MFEIWSVNYNEITELQNNESKAREGGKEYNALGHTFKSSTKFKMLLKIDISS